MFEQFITLLTIANVVVLIEDVDGEQTVCVAALCKPAKVVDLNVSLENMTLQIAKSLICQEQVPILPLVEAIDL